MNLYIYVYLKIYFIYLFLERSEGRETERERNMDVWLPLACPQLGTWLATQVCALTGNPTGDPLAFGSQAGIQSTEPHQLGLNLCIFLLPQNLQELGKLSFLCTLGHAMLHFGMRVMFWL